MGVVYLARDEHLERNLALKVIAPDLARSDEFRRRFIAEARSAAAIDHPNVVPVYSAGTVDDDLYLAMKYIEGTDLRAALAGGRGLGAQTSVAIATEVAAALDTAHEAGMVHRDVKPGNVLIEGEPGQGKAYLTDFGLTKGSGDAGTQLTGTGQWVGTIDYVAPEQIQGGKVDARTDVYALGCVLFETLSGRVPFGGNEMQKMWCHVNEPVPELDNADLPHRGELEAVLRRATAKDPADRFPSAGDLARAAAAAVEGERPAPDERSVAVGAAAEGLRESPVPAGSAPTITGHAPVPLRERPTTKLPSPPPAGSSAHGNSGRTAIILSAVAIACTGVIAAAIVISGSGSGDEGGATNGTPATEKVQGGGSPSQVEASSGSSEGEVGPGPAEGEDLAVAASADEWGSEGAYSTMLGAFSTEASARKWQRRAQARSLEAEVLYSTLHSSLTPGYWVVFSGRFFDPEEAKERAAEAEALDFPGSYGKFVTPN
jgi:serine/threonine protein kinase